MLLDPSASRRAPMDPITLSYLVVNTPPVVTPRAPCAFSGLSGVKEARISPLSPAECGNRGTGLVGEGLGGVGEEGADVG